MPLWGKIQKHKKMKRKIRLWKVLVFSGALEHVFVCRCVHAQETPKKALIFLYFWVTLRLCTSLTWKLRQGCKWWKCGNHVSTNIYAKDIRFSGVRYLRKCLFNHQLTIKLSGSDLGSHRWQRILILESESKKFTKKINSNKATTNSNKNKSWEQGESGSYCYLIILFKMSSFQQVTITHGKEQQSMAHTQEN